MTPPASTSPPAQGSAAPAMARRRPHRKSRTGCAECRRRRIKCTEERPSCAACRRHNAQCQYPPADTTPRQSDRDRQWRPLPRSVDAPSSGNAVHSPGEVSSETVSPSPTWARSLPLPHLPQRDPTSAAGSPGQGGGSGDFQFEMDDLVLLHHWTLVASREIYNCPPVDYCWQTVMPRIAFHKPFVMHGILSLAALHLAHTDRACGSSRTLDASRHHNISLQGFREAVNNITDDKSDALFAFSLLNVIYIFAMLRSSVNGADVHSSASRNARVLGNDWIPSIRGVQAVLYPVYDNVRIGPLAPLTDVGNWEDLDVEGDQHPDNVSFGRVAETWLDMADAGFYDEALHALRKSRMYVAQFQTMDEESLGKWGYNRGWAGPMIFLYTAPEAYFTRLRQRQPQALILFAYFGALLHALNRLWFLEGWGLDVVQVTDEILGDYWRPWMEWPRKAVGLA